MAKVKDVLDSVFKFGPRNLVGIDIGASAVRVAEVSHQKNSFVIERFGVIALPDGSVFDSDIHNPQEVIEALKESISVSNIKNTKCCMGLSGPNTMNKRLQIPQGEDEELEDQILWESEQYIPFAPDEGHITFDILGSAPSGGYDVMIAAARRETIQTHQGICKDTGLDLKVIDLDLFALANCFEVTVDPDLYSSGDGILLIDFGAHTTNILIFRSGNIIFTREMNVGGGMITEEISKTLNVKFNEAEDLKIQGDEQGNLPQEIVEIINRNLELYFSEIKKTINFFMTAESDVSVDHCFITGGASLTAGLLEGLEEAMELRVQYFNPLEKMSVNEKNISQEMIDYLLGHGAIVLGLALRSLDEK